MKPRRALQRKGSNIHWPFSLPPSDFLPVPLNDWTQQKSIDVVHTGQPPGIYRSEWRKVEMDLEVQMEKKAAWPLCESRERHRNIFVPQCFPHYNCSITNLHLLMGKCIYYILVLDYIRIITWKVKLNSLKQLNSLNWDNVLLLSHWKIPRVDVLNSLLYMLEF